MKKIYSFLLVAMMCNMAFAQKPTPSKKQEPPQKQAPKITAATTDVSPLDGESMKAWMAYMTPGPMHEMLATFNGDWREEVTFWMTPDAQPTTSSSTCTNRMVMDNRYQESTHKGMMNGMPFVGLGYLGYDNAKKIFVSTWLDNMGTGIMYLEGNWEEKTKAIHFAGTSVDPVTGKNLKVREEFKIVDDNNQILEMYMTQNQKEFKSMEIRFSR